MGLVEGKVMWEAMAIPETAEGKEIRVYLVSKET